MEKLRPLLANNFTFEGPLYQFDSADTYINALISAPPENFQYEIIQSFENKAHICLMFQFSKPGISLPMTQMFEIYDDKIYKILLIFDTRPFAKKSKQS